MMQKIDAAVVGAGPAGLTAGIYLGRQRLKTVVFEKAQPGGQMALSDWIENYPGFEKGIAGQDLARLMRRQALNCGAQIAEEEIEQIKEKKGFILKTGEGGEYAAAALIIAAGSQPKKLGIPGEDKFTGKGVSYCATCDAPLFKDKAVAVIGGGNAAAQEALYLSKYCRKVYLVHRRDRLRAAGVLAERIAASRLIEPVWNSVAVSIEGDKKVTGVVVANAGAGGRHTGMEGRHTGLPLQCDGVFIFAGVQPNTALVKGLVDLDEQGYVITDRDMRASKEGVFACGDVRANALRQIVTACADAAVAAVSAGHFIEQMEGRAYADFRRHSK